MSACHGSTTRARRCTCLLGVRIKFYGPQPIVTCDSTVAPVLFILRDINEVNQEHIIANGWYPNVVLAGLDGPVDQGFTFSNRRAIGLRSFMQEIGKSETSVARQDQARCKHDTGCRLQRSG